MAVDLVSRFGICYNVMPKRINMTQLEIMSSKSFDAEFVHKFLVRTIERLRDVFVAIDEHESDFGRL